MKRRLFSGFAGMAFLAIGAINTQAGDVTIIVKKSDGTPLDGVTLRYQRNSGGTSTFVASSATLTKV